MTLQEAANAIWQVLHECMQVVDATIAIHYPDTAGSVSNGSVPWIRATMAHIPPGKGSLAGAFGTRRRERAGVCTIQIFVPVGDKRFTSYKLAQEIVQAYEDSQTNVWFRKAYVNEVPGDSGGFSQTNVLVNFEYDHVR